MFPQGQRKRYSLASACARAMAAAQHVLKEICVASSQKVLLNSRRSLSFAAGRVPDTRRQSLTDEFLTFNLAY